MKQYVKWMFGMIATMVMFTNMAMAEKKYIPIIMDDLMSFAYITTNDLKIPTLTYDNKYRDLVLQCEDDVTYFIMAHKFYDASSISSSNGQVVIDENGSMLDSDGYMITYLKGHIDGTEPVSVTGKVYYEGQVRDTLTKTCNSNIDDSVYPAIPNYPDGANSYGILELNCKDDIIYYTLSYACFKQTVKLSVKANGNPTHVFKDSIQGSNPFIYYQFGYYERGGSTNKVEVVGTITGGNGGGPYSVSCP